MLQDTVFEAVNFLLAQDVGGLLAFFWYPLLLEIPRYLFGFVAAVVALTRLDRLAAGATETDRAAPHGIAPNGLKVSIVIAGHNEADAIETCVRSLDQQTLRGAEIVCVSDGSTDETYAIMRRLQAEGLVHKIAGCEIRGGKSSALNLAARLATGDILVVIDCDCSFDRISIEEIVRPFADPNVGAVSGNVLVRNWNASVVASLQAIEYMITISLGKALMDMLGQVSIISGAFGAFRREAWADVHGMDPGPGEDFDITMKMRRRGWSIAFAPRAVAYTDVPVKLFNLMRQRNRWERDAFWIRFRKHADTLDPGSAAFSLRESIHQLDFLVFNIVAAAVFPFYIVFLYLEFGANILTVLAAATAGLYLIDTATFVCGVIAVRRPEYWRLLPFMVLYGPFQSFFMRFVRLWAYTDEWIFSRSRHDDFAPPKVNAWIRWK